MRYDPRFLSRGAKILPGEKRIIQVGPIAAGADWTTTVPGGRQWRIAGAAAILTTSAVAGNRRPLLMLSDGTTIWWTAGPAFTVGPSTVSRMGFGSGVPLSAQTAASLPTTLAFPDMYLPALTTISTLTGLIDVGDQWSGVNMLVEEVWADDKAISDHAYLRDQAEDAELAAVTGQPPSARS